MRFPECRLLGVTFTLSRRLVLARGANRSRDLGFGVGTVGFRADILLGFGLPEAAIPTAALSRYFEFALCGFRGRPVFLRHPWSQAPRGNEPHFWEGQHQGQVGADAAAGSRADIMTTLSQEHRIRLASCNVRDHLGRSWTNWGRQLGSRTWELAARLRTRGDPDPFHRLDSFSRRKERKKIVQHAHRLDRFDLKLLDLVRSLPHRTRNSRYRFRSSRR